MTIAYETFNQICWAIPGWIDMTPVERSNWTWGLRWLLGLTAYSMQWFNEERQAVALTAIHAVLGDTWTPTGSMDG